LDRRSGKLTIQAGDFCDNPFSTGIGSSSERKSLAGQLLLGECTLAHGKYRSSTSEIKSFYSRFCGGDIPHDSWATQQLEITMKTTHKLATASAVAFSAFAFVAMAGSAAQAGPITPPGKYCLLYDLGGTDCSFTSYAQCQATAAGGGAECYGDTVRDDRLAAHKSGTSNY
jgi:Protein of unknown function (DUF3551)